MSKRFFIGLVILMAISLMGIIAVQYYWFSNLSKVNNELFKRSVNEVLKKTVNRLEMHNNIHVLKHIVLDDSLKNRTVIRIPEMPPMPPLPRAIEINVEHNFDTLIYIDSLSDNLEFEKLKEVAKIRRGINLRIETKFDSLEQVMSEVEEKMALKANELKALAVRVSSEFDKWQDGRIIDEEVLKTYLRRELDNKNMRISFNYAIIAGDSIVEGDFSDFNDADSTQIFKVALFPNDIFQRDLKLAVYFPDVKHIYGKKMPGLMLLSLIFTFVILLTFSLSIYFILRQKKISKMKSDFINNMTHEFKTPIATISVAADSITNEKVISDNEKVKYFAGMIKKENLRMNKQVEKILQIARLDKKDFEFHFQTVDAHELIMKAVQSVELQIEKREGHLEINLNAVNKVITTDPVHFTNVVYNLLDNAVKYSTGEPKIKISTTNAATGLLLSVEDKGIGMNKAIQSKIFERFYRQTSGNVHNVKGFGLGLSYVKAIVDANKGYVNVKSEPGKGSKFEVFVPFLL
jgi:two-component system phosphate regulon sensor histidine kinase PhoR